MSVWYAHNLYVQAVCEDHRSTEGKQGHPGIGVHRGKSRGHPIVSHIPAGINLAKFQRSKLSCNSLSTFSYELHCSIKQCKLKQLPGFVAAFPTDFTLERSSFQSAQASDLCPQGLCPHSSEEQFVPAQEPACSLSPRWT